MIRLLLTIALLATVALPAQASPWLQTPGRGRINVTYSDYSADTFFNNSGDERPLSSKFNSQRIGFSGEHGVTPGNSFIYRIGFRWLERESTPRLTSSGVGDVTLGWKHSLGRSGKYDHAVEFDVGVPTGYNPQAPLPLGRDSLDVTGTYHGGMLFPMSNGGSAYWNGYVGYRARLGVPTDNVVYGIGGGVPLARPFTVFAQISGVYSPWDRNDPFLDPSLDANSYDILGITAGGSLRLNDTFSGQLAHYWALAGRNTGKGTQWSVGLTARY
jgi:hypothetical protein